MGKTSQGLRSTVVIADAGPLIHLDELDALGVLSDFQQILVPDAVWREVERHRPRAMATTELVLVRQSQPPISPMVDAMGSMYTLHLGEREALACCLAHEQSLLLTDDTAARLAAKSLGVRAHGTVGLLIRAIRCQLRSKAEVLEFLAAIPTRSTLHIRPALLTDLIREVAATP
jgi:predicted nucleic acid-binding protein